MASYEKVTSAFAPDLDEVRAWLQKMIVALKFVEMVTAILALIGRMRDLNTELVAQLAHRAARALGRNRSSALSDSSCYRSTVSSWPQAAKPKDDKSLADEKKKRRGRHPGRGAPPRTCRVCPCSIVSLRSCASARSAAR